MAYVSYLHMEKTYRQPVQSEPTTGEIQNVTPEPITMSANQIVTTEVKTDKETTDTATIVGEVLDEGETYDSAEGESADDSNDASSVISSEYQRREILHTQRETTLPTSHNLQCGPINSQQHLTDSSTMRRPGEQSLAFQMEQHQREFKRKPKHGSAFPEQQQLMSSTSENSEEEVSSDV
ncbi:unnamed protein product [Rotaria sp. Silwood1]|nr:unnamed protein product [Rotaria sp. Silwood1]